MLQHKDEFIDIVAENFVNAYINEAPLVGKVVYLDAGHGGVDPGAYYKDIYEEDINLSITLKLRDYLLTKGCTVYLTRDGDYDLSNPKARLRKRSDLSNRASLIDKSNADLYLSIHLNSSTSTAWKGAQVFYDDINKNNKDFALIFQKNFNSNLGSKREEKEIKIAELKEGDTVVLKDGDRIPCDCIVKTGCG